MSTSPEDDRSRIHTDGGAFVTGGVNTGGGDFAGRDINKHYEAPWRLEDHFPLFSVASSRTRT